MYNVSFNTFGIRLTKKWKKGKQVVSCNMDLLIQHIYIQDHHNLKKILIKIGVFVMGHSNQNLLEEFVVGKDFFSFNYKRFYTFFHINFRIWMIVFVFVLQASRLIYGSLLHIITDQLATSHNSRVYFWLRIHCNIFQNLDFFNVNL